jgi:hypothetical protein
MSDITATVLTTSEITATIGDVSSLTVSSVGIQGGGDVSISGLLDVDAFNPDNGSVLVYKTITNKWTASTTLDAQNMEGGEF